MESRRPSKRSCRIHCRGHDTAATHPRGCDGSTPPPPRKSPSVTHTSIFYSSQFLRSHHTDFGHVVNIVLHNCCFFWDIFLLSQGYVPFLCALQTFFSSSKHFCHLCFFCFLHWTLDNLGTKTASTQFINVAPQCLAECKPIFSSAL